MGGRRRFDRKDELEAAERERRQRIENERIAKQRDAFDDLPEGLIRDHLKDAMLQRAYDLMCEGQPEAADALCEFLPADEADAMMTAWLDDQFDEGVKSKWH